MVTKNVSMPVPTKRKDDTQKETQPPIKETQVPSKETQVSKWLAENKADIFTDEFYKQGYYEVESVDDEAINSIVKPKQPGLANALKNSLAARKKQEEDAIKEKVEKEKEEKEKKAIEEKEKKEKEKEEKEIKPMVPPDLPAGIVFDLSAPKIPTADGITFSVTKSLSVESTSAAIISPNNIKREEWCVIARSANLLYAYDMNGVEPNWAKTPILDWKVPARDDFARSEILRGKVTSMLTYTDETASYVASGFDTQTATLAFTFCAGSFERSHKYKTATNSESKTLTQVGMWKYPRVKIYLDKCTVPSERFKEAVRKALTANDKFSALNEVFNEYGHVIPSAVLLGGQLCYKESKRSDSTATEASVQEEIKGKVAGKLGKVAPSAGFAFGSASEDKAGGVNLEEFTSFTNLGGDSLLCTNPPEWAPTVKDPCNWAVIEMEDMRPTIDLLEPELKKQVLAIWNSSQAILNPVDLDCRDGGKDGDGKSYPDNIKITQEMLQQNGGFAAAVRDCTEPTRGWVQLLSSVSKGSPKRGDPGTATGGAYSHAAVNADRWIKSNSICLPVPQGGTFTTMFGSSYPPPPQARLLFVRSNLHFGQWQCLSDNSDPWKEPEIKDEDGFLFVSIQANDGERGGVKGLLKDKEIAGSYVQNWHTSDKLDEWIEQQSFCVPVPGGTKFSLAFEPSRGKPKVNAYWIPLDDTRWKMQEAVPVAVNTQAPAETDGILHGWIKQSRDGDRGMLNLYIGEDAVNVNPVLLPCAAASMHYYGAHNCWVWYSSVMIPVAKGTPYKAVYKSTSGSPQAQVYWTAIVPR